MTDEGSEDGGLGSLVCCWTITRVAEGCRSHGYLRERGRVVVGLWNGKSRNAIDVVRDNAIIP